MNKKILFLFCFIIYTTVAKAQTYYYCPGDSVNLGLASYNGTLQWQESSDSLTWNIIPGATFSPYGFIFSTPKYYRAKVTAPNCSPVYSQVQHAVANPFNTIALSSAPGTDNQTLCVSTPITNIAYTTTGATGATFSGLPAGVSGNWTSNVATISGTPTSSGTFTYTVTMTGGCTGGTNTANGTITVNAYNTITLSSAANTNAQSVCVNNAITNITYSTTGATGAAFSGLPAGVSGNWTNNVAMISGAPTTNGTFTYTVTMTGGCTGGTNTASGTITSYNGPCYPAGSIFCNGPTAIVDVLNPATGKIWMDRNLGASQVATSSNDANSYGDLFQWGRGSDGHQCRTSAITTTSSSTDQPAHGDFITTNAGNYDWRNPQNNNLWQGINGVNNPCPSGYRLPTIAELDAERSSWNQNNGAGAFASPLKLPVAGFRSDSPGSLSNVGSIVCYWSSTVNGAYASNLTLTSSNSGPNNNNRAYGFSVRCLKD